MRIRTQITRLAHERGMTAAEIARRLGLYRSNLSAMDAGRRMGSLRILGRIAQILDCSPADLIEAGPAAEEIRIFRRGSLNEALRKRDVEALDGLKKTWVHAALLAWQRHYRNVRKRR